MRKVIKHFKYDKLFPIVFLCFLFGCISYILFLKEENILPELLEHEERLDILFTGDVFFDRHIDELSQKSRLKYTYPFQGLNTLDKQNYDAWIGNLECPVTEEQSTTYEKENYLKFSCKKEYLAELKKYFDIVSIANNHTDNMNGRKGIEETRKHLIENGIRYFGDYDSSKTGEICKIQYINNIPIVLCGYNGVFALPTEQEMKVIDEYSKYFVTFIMPHQGVEYEPHSNTYQEKIYHAFIDHGADAVIGSHPHVLEEVEEYKGKVIFYSLGNFIFDQSWGPTRKHMTVAVQIDFPKYQNNYKNLSCGNLSSLDCLQKAKDLKVQKPEFTLKYKPIFTEAGMDFITKKSDIGDTDYQKKLKSIGFDKLDNSLKQ
jgi:poly-gamma-glutamate synthesis protein (capsule biosynthesis protein)